MNRHTTSKSYVIDGGAAVQPCVDGAGVCRMDGVSGLRDGALVGADAVLTNLFAPT